MREFAIVFAITACLLAGACATVTMVATSYLDQELAALYPELTDEQRSAIVARVVGTGSESLGELCSARCLGLSGSDETLCRLICEPATEGIGNASAEAEVFFMGLVQDE